MTTSFAKDAIAILLDLAKKGEIDPWDVQVVEVFDRVLSQLAAINQRDLSGSGQAFLYASMLVLLKADSLTEAESPEDEVFAEEPTLGLSDTQLPQNLERHLRRRAAAQPLQRRRITLNELISQLKLVASAVEQPGRSRSRRPSQPTRSQAVRAITQLAHQENLSEVAAEIEQFLSQCWPQVSQGQDWLDLDQLLELRNDRVGVFWALLFLSAQSKVELSQSEFYQDLKLRPFSPEASVS